MSITRDNTAIINQIIERQQRLQQVSGQLKDHFVGLDLVIDKIISNIEAWFCLPQFLTRPTIVCLWGLTGNGKTDLVRRLVKGLDMHDHFVELQMTNKGSSLHYSTSLQELLGSSNVCPEEPGILLLDEMQRFRSVDGNQNDIHDYHFQDLWMLLSDGSFGSVSDSKQAVFEMLMEAVYWEDYSQASKKSDSDDDSDPDDDDDEAPNSVTESRRKFKQSYHCAKHLKKKLRLMESVEEVMKWDSRRKMEMLREKLEDKSIFRPEVYSKLLIFVSGNLDEAYKMANQTDETDIDADLFHKYSQRISLLTIKQALTSRFKPEQIARLGNSHVIYPSLSRSSYQEIIRRKVREVLQQVEEGSGLQLVPDKSVYDAIYRNGVFPVQGTRPVFSTISSFFESALPTFILACLQKGKDYASLSYSDTHLICCCDGELIKVKNEGDIDKIRAGKKNEHQVRQVAVHETGHAVAYASLFGYVPTQVAVVVASDDKQGFIGLHAIEETKRTLLEQIQVLLAGRMAEELIFGKDNVTSGAAGDIERATFLAANYVRRFGMNGQLKRVVSLNHSEASQAICDATESNTTIAKILEEQTERTRHLMKRRMDLVLDVSDFLVLNERIEPEQFIAICARHNVMVEYLDPKETVHQKFNTFYKEFLAGKR